MRENKKTSRALPLILLLFGLLSCGFNGEVAGGLFLFSFITWLLCKVLDSPGTLSDTDLNLLPKEKDWSAKDSDLFTEGTGAPGSNPIFMGDASLLKSTSDDD